MILPLKAKNLSSLIHSLQFRFNRFVNLSQDIADNFKCSVCLDIFEAPLELPCGHIYCYECIRSHFRSNSIASECPECRRPVQSHQVKPPNRKLLSLLQNLNIKCEHAGCTAVVKVEQLISHTRQCRFNRSSRSRGSSVDSVQRNVLSSSMSNLLGDDAVGVDRLDRLQQLEAILNAFVLAIENNDENEASGDDGSFDDDGSSNGYTFFIYDETFWERMRHCIGRMMLSLLIVFLVTVSVAAIVIGVLKLESCTQMPTLPQTLLALGVLMFVSVILETIRSCCYPEKLCIGLRFIQSAAVVSVIYLAVVVYSNLDYTVAAIPTNGNTTLTCDRLVFEFSFWYVSATLVSIGCVAAICLISSICKNLRTIRNEWTGSLVVFTFVYSVAIVGMIVAICSMIMGSVYFNSCPGIPEFATEILVYGCIGLMCWLLMLFTRNDRNCFVYALEILFVITFICIAADVHTNFPWKFTSSYTLAIADCDPILYTYSFVIVCINYVVIGATILMFLIYRGICSYLFFR